MPTVPHPLRQMEQRRRIDQDRGSTPPFTRMSLIQSYGIPSEDWGDPRGNCWLTCVEWGFEGQSGQRISMRSENEIAAKHDWDFLAKTYGFNGSNDSNVR